MTNRTADSLCKAVTMDMPVTPGARVDFGINNEAIYAAYQRAIRTGKVTADQLHNAILSEIPGQELTHLLREAGESMEISTPYDLTDISALSLK